MPMPLASNVLTNIAVGVPPLVTSVCGVFVILGLVIYIFRSPGGKDRKGNGEQSDDEIGEKIDSIGKHIQDGAMAFLKYEYSALTCIVLLIFILITCAVSWRTGINYLCGAFTSGLCGFIGMWICTSSNSKTAAAAERGLDQALKISFSAGSVMGLTVVCLGLGALSSLLMIFDKQSILGDGALAGFGMGASTVSIFARVGGGIYTKAADVGGDLVGKVEHNLPEDDPRNPATIADNVGDNVGDVAGMGADLFGSFAGSIIASALLGSTTYSADGYERQLAAIAFPFWVSMAGIVAAIIGIATIRTKENATQRDLLGVLRRGQFVAGIFQIGFMAIIVRVLDLPWKLFGCILIGLIAGLAMGIIAEFFTSFGHVPTRTIAKSSRIGPANVIIQGLAVGMYSCVPPALIIASVIIACKALSGPYGIALASTGLLSTLGITLATDAYGPVADNAGGIAEMAGMPPETRKRTDALDALGNTTAAIGKGFAVGSAVLTAVSLLTTYVTRLNLGSSIDSIGDQRFISGIIVGAMLPYAFSALTMQAVNVAAQAVIVEARSQFPAILSGTAQPDYVRCVAMITRGALHSMVFPVMVVILAPIIIGIGLGPQMLAGLLLGAITSGFMLGLMMGTSGGAWDNAKKFIETGQHGGKKSKAHKAAVVGDTVGDPFKDTSGPAINIQIKLMSYISVVLVPLFKNQVNYWWASLIIIGVILIFVPFWIYMTPNDLRPETVEKAIKELMDAEKELEQKGQIQLVKIHSPVKSEPLSGAQPESLSPGDFTNSEGTILLTNSPKK